MENKKYSVTKLSNAFSTGSGGANFERRIQAIFVLTLLVDGFSPILGTPIERIEFQAKHLGYDIDDLVVISSKGEKLLCQMKHSLAVTLKDTTFQEVITAAWSDFQKDSFNVETDKITLITSFIAKDTIDSLRYIHDQALVALNADMFITRIYQHTFTSQSVRDKLDVIKICIQRANNNIAPSNDTLWKFCQCFLLSIFDLDYENSINRILAQSIIRCKTENNAQLIWRNLADLCGTWNQQAATITLEKIPNEIVELFGRKKKHTIQNIPIKGFTQNTLWAAIALIGAWDENNEYDINAIEKITNVNYNNIQSECRKILLAPNSGLDFQNGKWKIKNRLIMIDAIRDYYFDNTVKSAFQVANKLIRERNKQFAEDNQFSIIIPASGRFDNSDEFRKGLIDGLCILANSTPPNNCSDNLLASESQTLIRNAFKNQNWVGLVSISDILSSLAEMNPIIYLESLEEFIQTKPLEIQKLFPTKQDYSFIDYNFISNILFTLEQLAWHEDYIVQCIRCLGELEAVSYEQTNWANTPINTIINILSPVMPQTCASIEKQKNAIQALKIDHIEIYWNVLMKLLPNANSIIITGTSRPKYLNINIPEVISITDKNRYELFQYYIQQAISIVGTSNTKLMQLSELILYMKDEEIISLFKKIIDSSLSWNDDEKCDMWIKLCDLKFQTMLDNEKMQPKTEWFKELCNTIDIICPQNILYHHKRFYLSFYDEFLFEENHWEKLEESKQKAVEEIYSTLGISPLIEFGKSVNSLLEVGGRLGQAICLDEFSTIISQSHSKDNFDFFSSLTKSFLYKNGVSVIRTLNIKNEEPIFIANLLKNAPFTQELIDMVPEYLPQNEILFWKTVTVPPCYPGYYDYDITNVILKLLSYHRASTVIYAIGQWVDKLNIESTLLYNILIQAPQDNESNKIHPYSVQKIIKHLQNSSDININILSDIEYIYLPWLDEYSPTKPKAINYRLANEPEYFCAIMENTFKKRSETSSDKILSEAVRQRLFQLTYHYNIVPGTDWNGIFHSDKFISWIATVKEWSLENDRYEVTMQTIGEGLSYFPFNDYNVIDKTLMAELNISNNDELRKGYYLGILNQRGVHFIDPEGKPEKELAQKFYQRADAVETLGYSRFAEILKKIADEYLSEAMENVKHHMLVEE